LFLFLDLLKKLKGIQVELVNDIATAAVAECVGGFEFDSMQLLITP